MDAKSETLRRDTPPPPSFDFRGATLSDCEAALASSSNAFKTWSQKLPSEKRRLLQELAQCLRARKDEVLQLVQDEIHCSELWARINFEGSVDLIEEVAALVTSSDMRGAIPSTESDDSYAFVFNRPLGVVLGIAPWNSPLVLGFRAIIAPIAAGNTVVLKGSELSPRTHTFILELLDEAGFPPGVASLILHKPEDAPEIVQALITHPLVRKVNFTGSTAVGRIIARVAGQTLKPVLLELGGKNCSLVLADADVGAAAKAVLQGATLNGGQICMSTDLAIVVQERVDEFREALKAEVEIANATHRLIMPANYTKLDLLISDAASHGATIHRAGCGLPHGYGYPVTIIENVDPTMAFFQTESFGPVIGIVAVPHTEHMIKVVNDSDYGLSAAIWTRNHYAALKLAQRLTVGAVHINASTVHDEATLPHGGTKSSGFGRFGASWGLQEFVETQTVTLRP